MIRVPARRALVPLAGIGLLAVFAAAQSSPSNAKNNKKPLPQLQSSVAGVSNLVSVPANDPYTLVEDMVARVDNKVITSADLENAKLEDEAEMKEKAQQSGTAVTDAETQEEEKDVLSELIDQQLLLERADTLGLNADTDVVLRLDAIRRQENLPSMEALQKFVESQGESYEDFKQNIKDGILTQKVIEQDVAPRISVSEAEMLSYYNLHKSDFVRQDEVSLSEIFISTQGQAGTDLDKLRALATQVQQRAARGEDFSELVTRYSNSDSEPNGGQIGFFKRGQLTPEIEKNVFNLPVDGVTPVITQANGLLILKVDAIHHAGQETFDEAKEDIDNTLYQHALEPELHHYLANLRQQAYILVRPGYVDTGASASSGVNLEHFERVLPSDLPKDTSDSDSKTKITGSGGGDDNF